MALPPTGSILVDPPNQANGLDEETSRAIDAMVDNAIEYYGCGPELLEICAIVHDDGVRMFVRKKPH